MPQTAYYAHPTPPPPPACQNNNFTLRSSLAHLGKDTVTDLKKLLQLIFSERPLWGTNIKNKIFLTLSPFPFPLSREQEKLLLFRKKTKLENLEKDEHEKNHLPTCGSSLPRQNNRRCLASPYSTSYCVFKVDCSRVGWQVATSYTNKIREMTNKVSIIQTPFTSGFTHLIEQKRFLKSHKIYRFCLGLLGIHTHTHTHKKKKRQPFISHLQSSHDQSSLPFSHTQSCFVNKKNHCF